ncbi:MAG TPA: hypothetical protein VGR52_10830 [Stellaceae bacterium]|nr:hypothetical protein [Stellaceae bacterium]
MMWLPELMKLLRILTHIAAIALVLCGTVMFLVSPYSQHAALNAVIFFAIAAGLAWSVQVPSKPT